MPHKSKSKTSNKMKVKIESDGTIDGTKFTINGEDVTKSHDVTGLHFSAHGGTVFSDGDKFDGNVSFSYQTVSTDDQGVERGENVSFSTRTSSMKTESLGKPKEKVNDFLIGKGSLVLNDIDTYRDKSVRFIPTREDLMTRTWESVVDLLADLKKEKNG